MIKIVLATNNSHKVSEFRAAFEQMGVEVELLTVKDTGFRGEIIEDAEWMLDTYEPRAEIDSIEVTPTDAPNGHFAITAKINTIKEADA